MADVAIKTDKLFKAYNGNEVLRGLNLNVPSGSIYAFLGRNGEGKTTTIRLILNIINPDSGGISVLGKDALKDPAGVKRSIGYVPEAPFFYDWMRIEEIFDFVRESFKGSWSDDKLKSLAARLAIKRDAVFGNLSMGMKAKVALAAAMAHNPEALLLDDPTSGLDVVVRREFFEALVEMVDEINCTVLFSTHLLTEVERIADHVGLLKNGVAEAEMSVDELKERVKRVRLLFDGGADRSILTPFEDKILTEEKDKRAITMVLKDFDDGAEEKLKSLEGCKAEITGLELEEIFVAYTRDQAE